MQFVVLQIQIHLVFEAGLNRQSYRQLNQHTLVGHGPQMREARLDFRERPSRDFVGTYRTQSGPFHFLCGRGRS